MRHKDQDKLRKISLRLKQYVDDPKNRLVHLAYINKKLADTYEAEKQVAVKDRVKIWAQDDFGLKLENASDLTLLRECIIGRYAKIFDLPEDRVRGTAWERYWIHLHIRKELNISEHE